MSATRVFRYKCYIDGCAVVRTEKRDLIVHFKAKQHPSDTWDINNVGEPVLCERVENNRYVPSTITTATTSSASNILAKPASASPDILQGNQLEDRIGELEQGMAEAAELVAEGAEALKYLLEKVEKLKGEIRTLRQGGE